MSTLHPSPAQRPSRWARGSLTRISVALAVLIGGAFAGVSSAGATVTPDVVAVADYLASTVAPDGSVISPYTSLPSVEATMDVALALAVADTQPAALGSTLAYVETHAQEYVTEQGMNVTGRYAYLIMLAVATGRDPRSFGADSIDLIVGLESSFGEFEAGMYGPSNPYYAVATQALAILALHSAGATVPTAAVTWLRDQQCGVGNDSAGGWQAYRAPVGAGLAPCDDSDGVMQAGADSNDTAFALQALALVGDTSTFSDAMAWLHVLQPAGGGFGWFVGDASDPSSIALVIQALVAMGQDPSAAEWSPASTTPYESLASWIIRSGPETGALASQWSSGAADIFATHQGLWGLAGVPFPLVPVQVIDPPSTTTTVAVGPVAPSFTG